MNVSGYQLKCRYEMSGHQLFRDQMCSKSDFNKDHDCIICMLRIEEIIGLVVNNVAMPKFHLNVRIHMY